MAVLLATGAALGWGAADFSGGAARRSTPVFVVVAVVELVGLAMIAPVLLARGVGVPSDPRLWLAAVSGLGVTIELGIIYLALSRGEAFITAPVGALGAAIAVVAGLLSGDRLGVTIALGLVCALAGASVSAWTSGAPVGRREAARGAALCVCAATGVAIMLTSFHAAGRVDPYWATAVQHAATALSAGAAAAVAARRNRTPSRRRRRRAARRQLQAIVLAAASGTVGDLAFATASRHGALTIVAAVSSLYPIPTIALGVAIQRHRPTALQSTGLVVALIGAAVLGAAS